MTPNNPPSNEDTLQSAPSLSPDSRELYDHLLSVSTEALVSQLSAVVGTQIEADEPRLEECLTLENLSDLEGGPPQVAISVAFSQGLKSHYTIILPVSDCQNLAAQMMGTSPEEAGSSLSEMQTSAVTEAINQLMNAVATSLASLLGTTIEVSNPEIEAFSLDWLMSQPIAATSFLRFQQAFKNIGSQTIHWQTIVTVEDAQAQVDALMSADVGLDSETPSHSNNEGAISAMADTASPGQDTQYMESNPMTTVQPVQFSSLDSQPQRSGENNKNLDLVMDVTLSLSVELGKAEISIKQVLELTRGSVIELDRIAGEPVDLLANGKLIAKGEVVVIEDNFGLRITSIVSPADRLRGL